jgi:hypothetical protein
MSHRVGRSMEKMRLQWQKSKQTCNNVGKAEFVSDVYYLGNSILSQRQDDGIVIKSLIK